MSSGLLPKQNKIIIFKIDRRDIINRVSTVNLFRLQTFPIFLRRHSQMLFAVTAEI